MHLRAAMMGILSDLPRVVNVWGIKLPPDDALMLKENPRRVFEGIYNKARTSGGVSRVAERLSTKARELCLAVAQHGGEVPLSFLRSRLGWNDHDLYAALLEGAESYLLFTRKSGEFTCHPPTQEVFDSSRVFVGIPDPFIHIWLAPDHSSRSHLIWLIKQQPVSLRERWLRRFVRSDLRLDTVETMWLLYGFLSENPPGQHKYGQLSGLDRVIFDLLLKAGCLVEDDLAAKLHGETGEIVPQKHIDVACNSLLDLPFCFRIIDRNHARVIALPLEWTMHI